MAADGTAGVREEIVGRLQFLMNVGLLPALALKLGGGHEIVALWIYRDMNAVAMGIAAGTNLSASSRRQSGTITSSFDRYAISRSWYLENRKK